MTPNHFTPDTCPWCVEGLPIRPHKPQRQPVGAWTGVKIRVVDIAADLMIEALCLPQRLAGWRKRRVS